MTSLYRVAFLLTGVPSFLEGTNWISDKFGWLGCINGKVQFVSLWEEDLHGTPVPNGTRIVLEVAATSADDAIVEGHGICESISRIMEFRVGAPHVDPRPLALLDVTPGLQKRRYSQWLYDAVPINPTRSVNPAGIEMISQSLSNRTVKEREAITRGLKWYTDALNESDAIDRFLKGWVGLESIGAIISQRVHPKGDWQNCKKCVGSVDERARDERQERGIRHIFSVKAPEQPGAFPQLKKARNKLVHSEWELSRVAEVVEPLTELTLRMLVSGLLTAMTPKGTPAGTRVAYEPVPQPARGADAVFTVNLLTANADIWGQLEAKVDIKTKLLSSWIQDGQYRGSAQIEIDGIFPCDYEGLTILSAQTGESGFELTVDKEPAFHEKRRKQRNEVQTS